ncbi:MAG: immunoglobulin-like domain-containing protein [Oscillospiraceae bacterium]
MKKRLVSILLVLVMVLGMLPTVAFAADTPTSIKSAQEFADMTAGGNYILTKDIEISTPYTNFSGTFDGNGHTITLKITANQNYTGLFTSLQGMSGGTTVKNLLLDGTIDNTANYNRVAAVAGGASALNGPITVENCKSAVTITGSGSYIAGIVGYCSNNSSSKGLLQILNCANTGSVSGKGNVGGIAGNLTGGAHAIQNCYNTGSVAATGNNVAGIVGWVADGVSITNCYTVGALPQSGTVSAIANCYQVGSGSAVNCYALEGTATELTTKVTLDDKSAFKTESEMKSADFAALLGDGFMAKAGSYPTLAWEVPTASKTFHITPAAATLTVLKGSETAYSGTGAEQTVSLPAGTYTYTVSCAGYETKNGDAFTVSEKEANDGATLSAVTVSLNEDASAWVSLTVTKSPAAATVTIKDAAGNTVAETNGSYKLLKDGAYTYTATTTEEGYEDAAGSVDLAAGTLTIDLPKVDSLTVDTTNAKTTYFQNEKLKTDGLVLTVHYTNADDKEISAADFEDKGVTAAFDSSKEGTADVLLSYKGKSVSYQVEIQGRPDVFQQLRPYATITYGHNSSYTGNDEEEFAYDEEEGALQSKSQGMGNSQVWVSIKLNENAPAGNISFWYKTDSESNYDYLLLGSYAYGATKYNQTKWTQVSFSLQPGKEQLLTFRKDSSGNNGKDCVWLKDFVFAQLYALELTTVPADANVTLKDAAGTTVTGTNGKYTVTPGTYTYEASAFGYESATGAIEVTDKDVSKTITLQQLPGQTVTFDLEIPETIPAEDKNSYTITIKQGATTVRTLKGENTTTLPDGSYTYTITHPNCDDVTGSFTVSGSAVTETKTLTRKLVFSDFFADCKGITATNHERRPWKAVKDEANGNYLTTESVATGFSSSDKTTILFEAADNVRLSFDVVPYCYGSSNRFVIYKNNKSVKTYDRSDKWESYSIDLLTGDTLLLEYTPRGTTYYTRLKNFKTEQLAKVNFTLGTAGASLVFTNKETGATYEPANGASSIVLPAGTYTYTASKFGCEDATGEFTVAGGETKNITVPALTELKNATVTFHVTLPEDCQKPYTVVIRKGGEIVYNETIAEDAAESCTLPVGTYTYTVSHAKCDDAAGELELAEAGGEIRVTLARKPVFEDFFAKCDGIIAANSNVYPYKAVKDAAGDYLISDSVRNYGKATITLTAEKALRLYFSYYGSTTSDEDCPFVVKNGTKTLLEAYGETTWKTFATDLAAGDKLTLTYEQPYVYGDASNIFVKLKDFRTEALSKVTFTLGTEGTVITVKNAKGDVVTSDKDGSYTLPDGNYTYTASKFGYKTVENVSFTVGGEDKNIHVEVLQPMPSAAITFQTDPVDAAVSVTHAAQGAQTANDNGTFTLVQGETYDYTVSKENYVSKSGAITVSGDETITVKLTYAGIGWDGTTKTEPDKSADGTYQISSAAELAWFADAVNNGSTALNAALTDNINLNGKTWPGIGTASNKYTGTFDGKYFMVSGLAGSKGLFDFVGACVIKNLTVSGAIKEGTNMGLLADVSAGTVENCFTTGSLHRINSYGTTGGLIGRADAGTVIRNCGSAANVSCSMKSLNAELNMGGLVGNLYGTVENSYATGTVKVEAGSGYTAVGGFIGQTKNTAAITNSYAAGTVTGSAGGALGAFVGVNSGSISGSYYREDAAEAAVAAGSADGLTAMTKAVMQSDGFIKDHLGLERYHVDTDGINGGYPIHAWQGGKEAELTEDEKAVTLDVRALVLKDAKQAALVQELCAQVQEETDEFVAETSLSMLLTYIRDDWGYDCGVLTSPEDAKPYVYQQFCKEKEAEYLEENGEQIDLSNTEGILTPDNNGIYHIKTQAQLALAATGENGSRISWHSDSDALNAETGAVTLPEADTITVKLTATAAKGTAEKSREITVILYSVKAEAGNVLGSIEKALSAKDAFVQPVQICGHETAMDAVSYWLYNNGYDDSIEVEFVSAGTLATTSVTGHSYLAEDGTVTYYQGEGGADTKYVTYTGVQFKLSKLGAEKTVTANVRIGWDVEKAQELMQKALDEQLTWEAIRGENTNTAKASTDKSFTGMVVEGKVSQKFVVPQTVTVDGVTVQIGFTALPYNAVTYEFVKNTNRLEITPRRPAMGQPATTFDLWLITLFDNNLDDYTLDAMMSQADDETSTLKLQNAFRITVKPETEDAQNVLSQNLKDKLPGLVTNYYDYGAKVDLTKPVKDDLLIPSLQKMSDAGIFDYDYSQMQKLESLTPDVADVNGYHITVYRPLPGQPAVEAKIKVQICERVKVNGKSTPGKVLGETTLTFTIEPLTQKEIDDAKALMTEVTQEEVYWQSIRGENTDKKHITTDLHPFYKIVKNDIGGYDYPTLDQVKNVEGIYTDDYPGYDPMASYGETYRTFYSSRRNIIKYENLLLTQPEYNTEVTIKSWLTYTQYAKYYEKFVKDAETPNGAYEQFATFYKHEVSTTVKVDGKQDIDEPEKPGTGTDIGVTVIVDGRDVDGFVSNKENPYAFEGKDTGDGITVAQVMQAFFKDTEYTSDSYAGYYGGYIAAITDPNGVKLEAATKERPYSGWMYTRAGKYADAINAEFVEDGDEIYFYYTVNYYLELDENSDEYRQYKALADDVANKIQAIPDEISSDNAEAFEKAVTIARSAYNDLDAGIREAMLDPQVAQKLLDAEAKLAEYEKNMDVYILRGLLQEITDEKNVTESEKQFVQKAEELYEGMEPELKKLVTKEESRKLTAARKSLAANERAAKKVSDLIASKLTGEPDGMGLNDRRTITSVETAYNKLTDAQKTFIPEAEKATLDAFTARRDYLNANEAEMKANEKAASAVEKLIKALPKAERVDYTDKAEIEKARTAYNELTDDQKKLVSNLDTLTAAEAALRKALDDVAADKSAAEIVIEMIQALPETVVYNHDDKTDADEIDAAREAYNNLGKVGKNIVGKDNLKLLTNAEKALKKAVSQDTKDQKAAAKVIAKIEKLPAAEDVIVKNKSAISAARKAYDRLNENAKKYADDSAEVIAKLADCEEALTQAIEDEDAAEAVEKLIKKLPTAKRVKEEHREKVQEALDAYNELTAEQKELVTAKNQQKLFDCCAALDISVDGGDIDLEALELQQEEIARQAAIIEQFVLAEDEDDASLEEDFDESVDE